MYPLFLLRPKAPSKKWLIGSLKGFFDPRQLPTAPSSPTRQHSQKSTKTTTTTTFVANDRKLPSDDSDIEDSPSKPQGLHALFRSPAKQKSKWKRTTIPAKSRPREGTILIVFLLRHVGLGGTGGALKDARVVGPRAGGDGGSWCYFIPACYDNLCALSRWQFLCPTVPRSVAEDTQARIVRFLDQKIGTRIPKRIQHPKIKTADDLF
jgi:hypothetical protein